MRTKCRVFCGLALFLTVVIPLSAQKKPEPAELSATVAESLMRQINDGLIAGSADSVLAAFASDQMPGYDEFAGELRGFLNRWDNIRVHYQTVQVEKTSCGAGHCGAAQVQFEMEADDVQSMLPPLHRGAQLQLTIERTDQGWKVVNFSPRELFR